VRCMTNEHLQEFLRIVEEWIRVYRSVEIAGLPGTERRAQLEKIMWQALQEIVEYSKSEEAAKKAEEKTWVHCTVHCTLVSIAPRNARLQFVRCLNPKAVIPSSSGSVGVVENERV
jgi:hypothetical protein